MKNNFLLFLFFTTCIGFSQIKATGYFNSEIGMSYEFSEKIQAELKIDDAVGKSFSSKLSVLYKIKNKETYNLNLGLGVNVFLFEEFDQLESFYIPFQLEILPFKNYKNIGFVLETAYHITENENGLRNSVGIRYLF